MPMASNKEFDDKLRALVNDYRERCTTSESVGTLQSICWERFQLCHAPGDTWRRQKEDGDRE